MIGGMGNIFDSSRPFFWSSILWASPPFDTTLSLIVPWGAYSILFDFDSLGFSLFDTTLSLSLLWDWEAYSILLNFDSLDFSFPSSFSLVEKKGRKDHLF